MLLSRLICCMRLIFCMESSCFQNWWIFNHIICHKKWAENNSNLYVTWSQAEAGALYFLWPFSAVFGTFYSPSWIQEQTSFRWGTNECGETGPTESSLCRGGGRPAASQPVSQRARLCQTRQSRVHSLPETRAVWLSSCYWLLFFSLLLSRVEQVSARFIFFPPASCQNTDCTELHTQALVAPPTISLPNTHLSSNMQHTISGWGCFIWLFFVFCGSP